MRRLSSSLAIGSAALAALGLAGCSGATDSDGAPDAGRPSTSAAAASADPISLSALVFNVEYGGSHATDAVMADVDADVVGVLESYNRLPKIAAAAGYPYYDVGLQILSKYPSSSRPEDTGATPSSRCGPARRWRWSTPTSTTCRTGRTG